MSAEYKKVYEGWKLNPEGFWAEAAEQIDWFKPADKVFDPEEGVYGRWFVGAECNTCYNAVDRHVKNGRGEQAAIIYDSPITGAKQTFTYSQLLAEVQGLAAVLLDQGVAKGDRVIIYMPMIPQACFAMMACARIGAIHSVVFGGFAANELATRLNDAKPKAIISASCGIEPNRTIAYKPLLDEAIKLASHKPDACIISSASNLHASCPKRGMWTMALRLPRRSRRRARCLARRFWRRTRCISFIPPGPPGHPRASCVTMAGIWSH